MTVTVHLRACCSMLLLCWNLECVKIEYSSMFEKKPPSNPGRGGGDGRVDHVINDQQIRLPQSVGSSLLLLNDDECATYLLGIFFMSCS